MNKSANRARGVFFLVVALNSFPWLHGPVQASEGGQGVESINAGQPENGQPAADVLGSEDIGGNPTFIGGLTNSGPQLNGSSTW